MLPLTYSFYPQNSLIIARWSLQIQPSSLWPRHQDKEKGKDQGHTFQLTQPPLKYFPGSLTMWYMLTTHGPLSLTARERGRFSCTLGHCYTQQSRSFTAEEKGGNSGARIKRYLKMKFRSFAYEELSKKGSSNFKTLSRRQIVKIHFIFQSFELLCVSF